MNSGSKDILLADEHEIVLHGLVHVLKDVIPDNANLFTSTTAELTLQLLQDKVFGICILDIDFPDKDGLELLHTIRRDYPEVKIIINTDHEEIWYIKDFVECHVEGILFKDIRVNEIGHAIQKVSKGEHYYCRKAKKYISILKNRTHPTSREQDVLRYISQGKSTQEIASLMGISKNTIETHRSHLLEKFKVHNVAELVMQAVSEGVLSVKRHKMSR